MFAVLLHIKNYKLFVVNMMLLGMGIAITVPYFVLFATKELGMTTNQFGILLALARVSQFTVNSIVARFSDTHSINRKVLIISALMMGAISFSIYFYIHNIWLFIIVYAIFQGLFAPKECHNYMHLHVNPLTFHLQEIMLNLPILFYALCFLLVSYLVR